MGKEVKYTEYAQTVIDTVAKGAFLTTHHAGKTNTMTIGWGSIGPIWRKPMFMVLVRQSRYTHELIEKAGEFTVSIPGSDLQQALGLCGTKSGRDMDKISAANLTLSAGQKIGTPVIAGCKLHFECKIVSKQEIPIETLEKSIQEACYPDGDHHTLYFGEILTCYED